MTARPLTDDELVALFDGATSSIVRVEACPSYSVPTDGDPAATDLYLRTVAATVARGVTWERLRVISHPPTDYERWELEAFRDSEAAGESVRVTQRLPVRVEDFWLFDGEHPTLATAVLMRYSDGGAIDRLELADRSRVHGYRQLADTIRGLSLPLEEYRAELLGRAS